MASDARPLPDWLYVSRETATKLRAFLDLVEKWNPRINLVSTNSLTSAWSRHVLDSAQLWEIARPVGGIWLDIGSGGGFPGVVIAILADELAPELRVMLVESDRRKSVFLSEAARQLQLRATVHCDRIETMAPVGAHFISSRAFAVLAGLLPMVVRHGTEGCVALFPKGRRYQAELEICGQKWVMQTEVLASKTDPEGAILKIQGVRHV